VRKRLFASCLKQIKKKEFKRVSCSGKRVTKLNLYAFGARLHSVKYILYKSLLILIPSKKIY
jgi:hypothetical protein